MKIMLKRLLLLFGLIGLLGAGLVVGGLIPVGASSGHWPITAWFLSFSMSRSIKTYGLAVEAPEKFEAWMVQKGAGHFEIGCKQCHGRPGWSNFLGQQMTPKAPKLADEIKEWTKEELFQIVKHGVKFTAMPAWPRLEREDEIWAVVSFLQQLPNMDANQYEKLVLASTNDAHLKSCGNCHGTDGNGRGSPAFPKLAGQNFEYLKSSLEAFAKGERHSGMMELASASLTAATIESYSRYFAAQKLKSQGVTTDPIAVERGKLLALKGVPEQKVASCVSCHGPLEEKRIFNPHYPKLDGQYAEYLRLQMKLIQENKRGGTKYLQIMHKALSNMTEEQIKDVSLYYQSLSP